MQKQLRFSIAAIFTVVGIALLGAATVFAAAPDGLGPWADSVVSFSQGLRDNGTAVVVERSDATNALGVAEGTDSINFVALGYGGELVLQFDNAIVDGEGDDVQVVETTYNSPVCDAYPEQVEVALSADGVNWTTVGTGCQDVSFDLADHQLACVEYVKLTDITDADDFSVNHITDGYDVDGVKALNFQAGGCEPEVDAAIEIEKAIEGYASDETPEVEPGTEVTYTYEVTNPGEVELDIYLIQDSHCSPIEGPDPAGDTDDDGLLDPGETWNYTCTQVLDETTTNKARVFGAYGDRQKVHDNDFYTVIVPSDEEELDCEDCETVIVSDAQTTVVENGDTDAVELSYLHDAWTASIPGATWIWEQDGPDAPVAAETFTFERTFFFSGDADAAILDIAADNTYSVWLNGELVGEDATPNNFGLANQDQYDVANALKDGVNTLVIEVTNLDGSVDPLANPGGLLYRLEIDGDCECLPYETNCTNSQGYWKMHSGYGNEVYDDDWDLVGGPDAAFFGTGLTWYEMLDTPPAGGNAYVMLAHQYIAAYLNIEKGADDADVAAAMAEAYDLLDTWDWEDEDLQGGSDADERDGFIDLAELLESYNTGEIGPGYCEFCTARLKYKLAHGQWADGQGPNHGPSDQTDDVEDADDQDEDEDNNEDEGEDEGDDEQGENEDSDEESDDDADEDERTALICHKPGTAAQQTLEVNRQAWKGHRGHGDTMGACPTLVAEE